MRIKSRTRTMLLATWAATCIGCINQDDMQPDKAIRYLALGDSYTIGQGVEASQNWPNQLSIHLNKNGYNIVNTDIIAQTGWKTSDLLQAVSDPTLDNYNLVSLLIGVNNQFTGQPFELFISDFDSLLNRTIDLAEGSENVFVLSIPDYGVTSFGNQNSELIAREIDMYNDHIRERCNDQNLQYINITEISRQLGDSPLFLAPDNLHPSGAQYAQWVENILLKVIKLLEE